MASSDPLIPHFFAGKSIFITGATGFMGKVLLYRLLTACPDIRRIYLLMRTKKEVPPEQRLQQLINSQIFDELRQNCPSQLDKLVMIPGDVTQPQLGIASENLISLNEVSIVFHSAATVKLNEELRKAVDQNVRPAIRLTDICDRLPHLEALIYVSTAYSNSERDTIEEVVYESPVPLDQVLALVDSAPPHLLAEITDKYIYPKPNTYTFTKAVAENYVDKHVNRRYSVAIFRPTIVISAQLYPVPGWIENLNGPSGVIVAAGKGYLHVFPFKKDVQADMIPVDIVIDTMIAVAWETAVDRSQKVRVYNCSSYENPTTWAQFRSVGLKALRSEVPLDGIIWYPFLTSTVNKYAETTLELLWQRIPMHLAEYGARIFGIKTRFSPIMVAQRLRAMSEMLRGFCTKEFHFETSNVRKLRERLSPADAKIFNLDVGTINWDEQFVNFVKGTRRYLLGEKDQDLEEARRKVNRMWYLHLAVSTIPLMFFLGFILRNPVIKGTFFKALRLMMFLLHAGYLRVTTPKYMN